MLRLNLMRILLSIVLMVSAGCGPGDGPVRYDVEGRVTFDGKPVAIGTITFTPDNSAGNSGPGGLAVIKDGKFDTDGKGVVGGPYVVRIVGYDGVPAMVEGEKLADGTPMFVPRELKVDFAKLAITRDFELKPE